MHSNFFEKLDHLTNENPNAPQWLQDLAQKMDRSNVNKNIELGIELGIDNSTVISRPALFWFLYHEHYGLASDLINHADSLDYQCLWLSYKNRHNLFTELMCRFHLSTESTDTPIPLLYDFLALLVSKQNDLVQSYEHTYLNFIENTVNSFTYASQLYVNSDQNIANLGYACIELLFAAAERNKDLSHPLSNFEEQYLFLYTCADKTLQQRSRLQEKLPCPKRYHLYYRIRIALDNTLSSVIQPLYDISTCLSPLAALFMGFVMTPRHWPILIPTLLCALVAATLETSPDYLPRKHKEKFIERCHSILSWLTKNQNAAPFWCTSILRVISLALQSVCIASLYYAGSIMLLNTPPLWLGVSAAAALATAHYKLPTVPHLFLRSVNKITGFVAKPSRTGISSQMINHSAVHKKDANDGGPRSLLQRFTSALSTATDQLSSLFFAMTHR